MRRQKKQRRTSIARHAIETAIATGVKSFDPACEAFVGVLVERAHVKSPSESNWKIKGIRFGRAEREKCSVAIAAIVERMQLEYEIVD